MYVYKPSISSVLFDQTEIIGYRQQGKEETIVFLSFSHSLLATTSTKAMAGRYTWMISVCIILCLSVFAAGEGEAAPSGGDQSGGTHRRHLNTIHDTNNTVKWSPGFVSATFAEALADVLRTNAQAKANIFSSAHDEDTPEPVGGKSKSASKDFVYTSIRLTTSASDTEDDEEQGDTTSTTSSLPPVEASGVTTAQIQARIDILKAQLAQWEASKAKSMGATTIAP